MNIYLIEQGGQSLQLPVNPSEIAIQRERRYETVNIINLGEIDFSDGEKVHEVAFSSFFPAEYDSSYCQYASVPDPVEAMNQLTSWMDGKTPVRLIIAGMLNTLVQVSAHKSAIKGGEPGDIYFDINLRTWREIRVRTQAEAAATVAGSTPRADLSPVPKTYTIKTGDTLWAIAKLQLGDGSRWSEIYALNKGVIGNKPEMIYSGTELRMPS